MSENFGDLDELDTIEERRDQFIPLVSSLFEGAEIQSIPNGVLGSEIVTLPSGLHICYTGLNSANSKQEVTDYLHAIIEAVESLPGSGHDVIILSDYGNLSLNAFGKAELEGMRNMRSKVLKRVCATPVISKYTSGPIPKFFIGILNKIENGGDNPIVTLRDWTMVSDYLVKANSDFINHRDSL